ncbi:MAG: helix-turn-helix transcriptional regulator [Chloroflexi bacterium]|nr:helix-turn-helix transcriptional regulator [Chloroflexota bacterium]
MPCIIVTMPSSGPARERLADLMEERRVELGLRWVDVAEAAGITAETLRQVRSGHADIRPLTARAIEQGLRWKLGSIKAVLAGGEPDVLPEPVTATRSTTWNVAADVTPAQQDGGYVSQAGEGGGAMGNAEVIEVIQKMAEDVASIKDEISDLRKRLPDADS